MDILNKETMDELAIAFEDLRGVWPNISLLAKMSTLWEDLSYTRGEEQIVTTVMRCNFGRHAYLEVREYDGEVQVFIN